MPFPFPFLLPLLLLPQAPTTLLPGDEGPLRNDAYQPFSRRAEERLAAGDALYARLTSEPPLADPERAWTEVFENWRAALVESAPGDVVPPRPVGDEADEASPWPDPDGTAERRAEGVEKAVLRRIRALPAPLRAAWSERFAGLADEALEAAARATPDLAEVERLHPATPGAALAAVLLSDRAFEEARPRLAAAWLDRAAEHGDLSGASSPDRAGHLDARRAACRELIASLETPLPAPAGESWRTATDLRPIGSFSLRGPRPSFRQRPIGPGVDIQPGLCFLADGTVAIQAPERVYLREPERGARVAEFVPARLIEEVHWAAGELEAFHTEPPGWPLLPATDGRSLVMVQGRASGLVRNVLMCVEISHGPEPLVETAGAALPRLRWALMEGWRYDGEGPQEPSGLGLESPEFQPGPLVVGSQVIVQVRERGSDENPDLVGGVRTENEVRAWVVALDLATGRLRWKRMVAKGVPISRTGARFGGGTQPVSSAQAPVHIGGGVFAGTHLGVGALVELVDGRLAWTLKNRRREIGEPGWSGWRPPVDPAAGTFVWAPADGDHLYWLRSESRIEEGRGLLVHPPRHVGEAEALLGGNEEGVLVLTRAGRERTASAWNASTGGRLDAPYLGPGEVFTGHGLVSGTRLLFATDSGAVLLDRERELFLLDYVPLRLDPGGRRGPPAQGGGNLYARGDRVWVVGRDGVWILAAS